MVPDDLGPWNVRIGRPQAGIVARMTWFGASASPRDAGDADAERLRALLGHVLSGAFAEADDPGLLRRGT